jgi:hypothetical protein
MPISNSQKICLKPFLAGSQIARSIEFEEGSTVLGSTDRYYFEQSTCTEYEGRVSNLDPLTSGNWLC